MSWLLKLYPRAWRQRYGAELEEVVASQPRTLQLVIDLLGGAVDAHVNPQALARRFDGATAIHGGGRDMVTRLKGCGTRAGMSGREALLGAGLTLGAALVVAAIMLVGSSPLTETIGLTMFPGVLVIGLQATHLRGHSTAAKVVLIGGMFLVLFLIGLAAGLVRGG